MSDATRQPRRLCENINQVLLVSPAVKMPVASTAVQIVPKHGKAWLRSHPLLPLVSVPASPTLGHTGLLPPHPMSSARTFFRAFAWAVSPAKELSYQLLVGLAPLSLS